MRRSLLALAWLAGSSTPAFAANHCVKLEYERAPGAETCEEIGGLKAAVEARIARKPWLESSPRVFRVIVAPEGDGLTGTILEYQDGTLQNAPRVVSAPGKVCHVLIESIAFVLANRIEPTVGRAAAPEACEETPSPTPTARPPQALAPDEIPFGNHFLGDEPARRTLQIANLGDLELRVAEVEIEEGSSPAFRLPSPVTAFAVPGRDLAKIDVLFEPRELGEARGRVVLRTNDPVAELLYVDLRGIGGTAAPTPTPTPPPPPDVALFAGNEGGYSFRTGGDRGIDRYYQSLVWSGSFVAGGSTPIGKSDYDLEVTVMGYGAAKKDTRFLSKDVRSETTTMTESADRLKDYKHSRTSVTAMRAAVRWDGDEASVTAGLLVGGVQRKGCGVNFRFGSTNCEPLDQWLAVPSLAVRLGPKTGVYAKLGFLDDRFLATGLAHVGAGMVFRNGMRAEVSAVGAVDGLGGRAELEIPLRGKLVLMPTLAAGNVYDEYLGLTKRSSWVRAGMAVGMRR